MDIRILTTDDEIRVAFPLMRELRDRITAETFVADVRAQQADGYVLAGGYAGDRLVTLAGFRPGLTLSRGPHLFVDDLVTAADEQGKGHGQAMIAWLRTRAVEMGLPMVALDSRATAKGFYERCGFTMYTSIPCGITSETDGGA